MAITYDPTNNIITVTAGTEAAPNDLDDLYTADKAGTLSLHDRDGITAVDGAPVNCDRNLCPADEVLIGGTKNDLYLVVENWTNMTTATIRLIGTDENSGALTEDIVVNGNGTFNATDLFKTLTQTQVTVFTKSDAGSFDYELIQGQWGVVWKQGDRQFGFTCRLQIGDGSTETWLADENKEIVFLNGAVTVKWQIVIDIKNNARFRMGVLVDETDKITRDGCYVVADSQAFAQHSLISVQSNAYIYIYSSIIDMVNSSRCLMGGASGKIYNSLFNGGHLRAPIAADFYNVIWQKTWVEATGEITGSIEKLTAFEATATLFHGTRGGYHFDVNNAYIRQLSAELSAIADQDCHFIDVDSDNWTFVWWAPPTLGKAYRQYTFNLKVVDKDGNALSGFTVILYDKNDNQVFQETTDANGEIPEQTVSYKHYEDDGAGNTVEVDYGPHHLHIDGGATYLDYNDEGLVLDEKTDLVISLVDVSTIITHLTDIKGTGFVKDTDSIVNVSHKAGSKGTDEIHDDLETEAGDIKGTTFVKDTHSLKQIKELVDELESGEKPVSPPKSRAQHEEQQLSS